MGIWIIRPQDSLIVRDGRPFSNDGGARANSLPFVTPSMVAGAIRQRIGSDVDGVFNHPNLSQLKKEAIKGPLLIELQQTGSPQFWVTMPADALLMDDIKLEPLVPLQKYAKKTNLPSGDLCPVGLRHPDRRKASSRAYIRWDAFEQWLQNPVNTPIDIDSQTMRDLPTDLRVHVSVDKLTRTVGEDEGKLFSTKGIEFRARTRTYKPYAPVLSNISQFAVAVYSGSEQVGVPPAVMTMGGERRIVHWQHSDQSLPAMPKDILASIKKTKSCRIVLLTPALFKQGWIPHTLLQTKHGVTPTLVAASVPRAVVLSGWDMVGTGTQKQPQPHPKPSQRYVPSGSVYFLKLEGTEDGIDAWANSVWMHNGSDSDDACNDGFGLAVLGTWEDANDA